MVLALVALWFRGGTRGDLFRLVAGIAIFIAVVLIDVFVESPREESTRKMEEIRAATKAKNVDDVAKHISESFKYEGTSKAHLLEKIRAVYQIPQFEGVDMTGFSRADFQQVDIDTIKIGFEAWPAKYGLPEYRYYCWATFVKDPDGQYRMRTFELHQPAKRPSADQKPVVPDQLK